MRSTMTGVSRAWPAPLRAGDLVVGGRAERPVEPRRLTRGVTLIESWGLRVRVAPHVFAGHRELAYLAASDEERAIDVPEAWCDPDVRAIWAARGGYGCQRMVDLLDFAAMRASRAEAADRILRHHGAARPDRARARCGHHPRPRAGERGAAGGPPSATALRNCCSGARSGGRHLLTGRAMIAGSAVGMLAGGNLSLLAADVGIEPAPREPCDPAAGGGERAGVPGRPDDHPACCGPDGSSSSRASCRATGLPDDTLVVDRLGALGFPILGVDGRARRPAIWPCRSARTYAWRSGRTRRA